MRPRLRRQMLTIKDTQPKGPEWFKLGAKDLEKLASATSEAERHAITAEAIHAQRALIEQRAAEARHECLTFDRLPAGLRGYISKAPQVVKIDKVVNLIASVGPDIALMTLRKARTAKLRKELAGRETAALDGATR